MKMNAAVRMLHNDMNRMRHAVGIEKKADRTLKADATAKAAALAKIATQSQGVVDQFLGPTQQLTAGVEQNLLAQMFKLGQQQARATSHFDGVLSKDKKAIAHDKQVISSDRRHALKDLRAGELQMNLKDTNRVRSELGLHSLYGQRDRPS